MQIIEQVGVTAGKVWNTLNDLGPLTVAQLKKKLNVTGESLNYSLGWLAREDKIEILQEKKSIKVSLK